MSVSGSVLRTRDFAARYGLTEWVVVFIDKNNKSRSQDRIFLPSSFTEHEVLFSLNGLLVHQKIVGVYKKSDRLNSIQNLVSSRCTYSLSRGGDSSVFVLYHVNDSVASWLRSTYANYNFVDDLISVQNLR